MMCLIMLRSSEVLAEPKVDLLVNAAHPESRAYTIDGIALPDFDAFTGSDVRVGDVPFHYIVKQDELGMSMATNILPGQKGLQGEYEQMDSIKAWVLESLETLQYPIPEEGLPVKLFLFFLFGPVENAQAKTHTWHMDMDEGALTVFEVDSTETLDEVFQDAYPLDNNRELVLIEDAELKQHAGQSIDEHIRRPAGNQTLYVGRRNIHRQPPLIPGQFRKGVICFLNSEL